MKLQNIAKILSTKKKERKITTKKAEGNENEKENEKEKERGKEIK